MSKDEEARALFINVLGMDLRSASTLVENGITSLEETAYAPFDEITSMQTLREPQLQAWRKHAREYLQRGSLNGDDAPQSDIVKKPLDPLAGGAGAIFDENKST